MDKIQELRQLFRRSNLSDREIEITILVIKGLSNIEIANQLFVGEKAIKWHLTKVYKKLKVDNHFRPRYHLRYVYDPYVNPGRYQSEPPRFIPREPSVDKPKKILYAQEATITVGSDKIKLTPGISILPEGLKK